MEHLEVGLHPMYGLDLAGKSQCLAVVTLEDLSISTNNSGLKHLPAFLPPTAVKRGTGETDGNGASLSLLLCKRHAPLLGAINDTTHSCRAVYAVDWTTGAGMDDAICLG